MTESSEEITLEQAFKKVFGMLSDLAQCVTDLQARVDVLEAQRKETRVL